MGTIAFAGIWIAFSLIVVVSGLAEASPIERALLMVFPALGLAMLWAGWRQLRRRRSLRTETVGEVTFYTWVDFDGTVRRSDEDPRPAWDAESGDGDGGDGGGD